MLKPKRLSQIALICVTALACVGVAYARMPDREATVPAPRATPQVYPRLEADFSIDNWRKSDKKPDLVGTMTVRATGGNGHYTYEFIGLRYTNTFEFRWRACSVLVNSLRVWSGDGQQIDVPVWREDVPCHRRWLEKADDP